MLSLFQSPEGYSTYIPNWGRGDTIVVTLDMRSTDPHCATLQYHINGYAIPVMYLIQDLHISPEQITGDGFRFGVSLEDNGAEYSLEEFCGLVDPQSTEERLKRAVYREYGSPTSPHDEIERSVFIQDMLEEDGVAEDFLLRYGSDAMATPEAPFPPSDPQPPPECPYTRLKGALDHQLGVPKDPEEEIEREMMIQNIMKDGKENEFL